MNIQIQRISTLCLCFLASIVAAEEKKNDAPWGLAEIKANYTKYEYRIPMRDGVRLMTAVYVPKDSSQTYPIMYRRTPYNIKPYGADQYQEKLGPSVLFDKSGYIFVLQDVRGRWMSEGKYENVRPHISAKKSTSDIDESSDTYDTIDWLVKHVPNNNGKVGMWGISYPGFYTAAGMIDAHPALKAASPQAPVTDWFVGDDWHHNGALFLNHMFNFMSSFDRPRPEPTKKFEKTSQFEHESPDGYEFFLKLTPLNEAVPLHFQGESAFVTQVMQHGAYDEFWQARNIRQHLVGIKPAVLTVGGWFDAENLFGAMEVYRHLKQNSPQTKQHLVMGPWDHGQWAREEGLKLGDVSFNSKTAEYYREKIEFPFFEYHLKGKGEMKHPEAWVFETGTNVWRQFEAWPPAGMKPRKVYFQADGELRGEMPGAIEGDAGFDEYVSDPKRPVPFFDKITPRMEKAYMTSDQRFASRRPDVLVYSTGVLEDDLTLAGPIEVDLYVSTTGTDADWIVKLIDVYPDDYPDETPPTAPPGRTPSTVSAIGQFAPVRMGGYQQLVRGDVMRGKFRNSFEQPEPFVPGEPTRVRFTLQDTSHTFRTGHRLMVQVQSSWFPLVDRNPQVFTDIYSAREEDFQKATQRVYRTKEMPSGVLLPVLR